MNNNNTGMLLIKTSSIRIFNNSITECHFGILSNSNIFGSCIISNNNITNCTDALWLSNYNCVISNNRIIHCGWGMSFYEARDTKMLLKT